MKAAPARPVVAVIGLGLIGGSLARALAAAGYDVIGVDRPSVRRAAARARVRLRLARGLGAAREADILVLAASPRANLALLRRLARGGSSPAVITDVGSVKAPIVAEARRLGLSARFVGGHPLSGRETSGFAASSADLFRGRAWVLTPDGSAPAAVRTVRGLVRAAGARAAILTPAAHDRAVAFLSHLPQLVAWALAEAAASDAVARRALVLAGGGYRDMTRLARSPWPLWREILAQNRGEIARARRAFVRALGRRRLR